MNLFYIVKSFLCRTFRYKSRNCYRQTARCNRENYDKNFIGITVKAQTERCKIDGFHSACNSLFKRNTGENTCKNNLVKKSENLDNYHT